MYGRTLVDLRISLTKPDYPRPLAVASENSLSASFLTAPVLLTSAQLRTCLVIKHLKTRSWKGLVINEWKKSETADSQHSGKKIKNTQKVKKNAFFFNRTKQNKMREFSRKSSLSKLCTTQKQTKNRFTYLGFVFVLYTALTKRIFSKFAHFVLICPIKKRSL